MIDSLFVRERVRLKQREAPLLKERERYLIALLDQGVCKARVRSIACILLHVIRLNGAGSATYCKPYRDS